jgi:hypothetical protein
VSENKTKVIGKTWHERESSDEAPSVTRHTSATPVKRRTLELLGQDCPCRSVAAADWDVTGKNWPIFSKPTHRLLITVFALFLILSNERPRELMVPAVKVTLDDSELSSVPTTEGYGRTDRHGMGCAGTRHSVAALLSRCNPAASRLRKLTPSPCVTWCWSQCGGPYNSWPRHVTIQFMSAHSDQSSFN